MSLSITFLGHSGFLFDDGSVKIAIDPFLTGNPLAVHRPDEIECQHIILTHGHADHLGDTVAIAKNNNATVHGAFELTEGYLSGKGVENVSPMNPGGCVSHDFGWIALTQAFHSSSHEGVYTGQPCGVMLHLADTTMYHAGDTGIFSDMKLLAEIYKPTIAMLPIGDRFTMGPELAERAAEMINPKHMIPIHYDTWPPIAQDPSTIHPAGVNVKIMKPGDVWEFAK